MIGRHWRGALVAALPWIAGGYLLWLTAAYLFQTGTVHRRHLEAASFVFIAILLVTAALRRSHVPPQSPTSTEPARLAVLAPIGIASAVVLYYPVIGAGLFSDDFGLLHAARQGRWTVWSDLFRPTLFLTWRTVDALTTTVAPLLHLTNIALHGVNAAMVSVLGARIGLSRWAAVTAGALFLCFPAAVEAVTWPAGFQDVAMTTLVLAFLLVIGRAHLTPISVATSMVILVAACVTKETAVVAPMLAALLACGAGQRNWKAIALSFAVVAAFLAVRFTFLPAPEAYVPGSRYALKEVLVRPFASLIVPLRTSEAFAHPIVVWLLVAIVVIAICSVVGRRMQADRNMALAVVLTGFVICSIAPLARFFVVMDDLQGSRYLYLGSAAWTLLLATLFARADRRLSWRGVVSASVMLVCWIVAVRAHQRPWLAASEVVDQILTEVARVPADCREVAISGLPDGRDGVPIFLNGFVEAASERAPDHTFRVATDGVRFSECHFTWDGTVLRRESRR